ncbi:hypothetical protein PPERSA_10949 [Pseudocohnilembus persalinus]|uniref:Serine aminopeptidase S33 domain-containing protein n=1 Tax=Pseudocohnilembus persalinus TaxID=266149 RepID=A0A0V0QC49_PSEPJ|nr:hypothetical protein PPERSA_10949 [Pseudocohnilembus persalinus]|eukprot:KRW99830.1 hypothetical protein PPERSA_10949 [Pseudocohnilembus persalinus]
MELSNFFEFFKNLTLLILAVVALIAFLLYMFQNKILYIPVVTGLPKSPSENPKPYRNPTDFGLEYENVYIKTSDNLKLHGWFIKQIKNSESAPTILYYHENAGNIGTRLYFLNAYYQNGYNVMLIAYRGYSDSEGIPSESGLYLDAQAILDHLFNRNDIDVSKIFIHGRSLGGAMAIYSASETKFQPRGLILENTFTSISDMVDVIFPKLSFLKAPLIRNHFKSVERIGKIKVPILFIFAMKDQLVPPKQMAKLFESAVNAQFKRKHIIEDGDHNSSWALDVDTYFENINKFTNEVLKQAQE